MRERQPGCSDLVVAGRSGVQDSPRDIQVRLGVAVIQCPPEMADQQSRSCAQGCQEQQHQGQLKASVFQNSVNARNSLKRASISARVNVRNRSTPNFSQQKLPITEP